MSVTAQIPDTSAFQEALFPSLDNIRGILLVGNFVYAIGGTSPGWIIQLDKNNLSSSTVLHFPNDGKHIIPIDLCHAPSTGHIYVLFRNIDTPDVFDYQLTIGRVSTASPFTILSDFVDTTGVYLPQGGSITTDDAFVYVAVAQPTSVLRYRLSDAALTPASLGSLTFPNCIRYSVNKLYMTGLNLPITRWVGRMSTSLTMEQSATFDVPGGAFTGNFGVSASHLWIGTFATDGIVKRVLKSDVGNIVDIATGQLSRGVSVDFDGTNIWELFENGRGARINPSDSSVSLYTVNPGQDYHREITGDGTYIFAGSFIAP